MRVAVDLDKEAGKAPRPGRTSVYYLQIRESTQIRLQYVHAYLQGKVEWDKHILEGLSMSLFFSLPGVVQEWWHLLNRNRFP